MSSPFTGPVPKGAPRPTTPPIKVPQATSKPPTVVGKTKDGKPITYGGELFDVLNMGDAWVGRQDMPFTLGDVGDPKDTSTGARHYIDTSISGGLEWLVDESRNNKDGYNDLVTKLYQAGYLKKSDVRFNAYSPEVAQAFVKAAYAVSSINARGSTRSDGYRDPDAGYSLDEHLNSIIEGYAGTGLGPAIPGADKPQGPTRKDQWTDPDTLKATARTTAQSLLGRSLSASEEKAFLAAFKERESRWNGEVWTATQAVANGQAASVTSAPRPDDVAQNYVGTKFAQEKAGQDLGSYMGVIRNMVGLGSGGIGLATR